jgi:uncharacterized OsmC-like protein
VKITLLSDDAVRFDGEPGPLTIEAPTIEQTYSPFHMLGSSLAVCTHSVLHSWATHAKLEADDLAIEVRWTFVEHPHRVGGLEMALVWPSLPANRREAAKRASALCPIHATLSHSAPIEVTVVHDARDPAAAAPRAAVGAGDSRAPAPTAPAARVAPTPPAPVTAPARSAP